MDLFLQQIFDLLRGGAMTVPVLLLLFAAVMGCFPGHNARRRNHPHADRVNAAAWCLIFISVAITVSGLLQGFVALLLVLGWVAIATWSYGRTPALPKARRCNAFEVIPAEPANLEANIANPALGA